MPSSYHNCGEGTKTSETWRGVFTERACWRQAPDWLPAAAGRWPCACRALLAAPGAASPGSSPGSAGWCWSTGGFGTPVTERYSKFIMCKELFFFSLSQMKLLILQLLYWLIGWSFYIIAAVYGHIKERTDLWWCVTIWRVRTGRSTVTLVAPLSH